MQCSGGFDGDSAHSERLRESRTAGPICDPRLLNRTAHAPVGEHLGVIASYRVPAQCQLRGELLTISVVVFVDQAAALDWLGGSEG